MLFMAWVRLMSLKRGLYSFFLYLIFPFVLIRLFWRSRHNVAYRQRIGQRLGWYKTVSEKPVIWVHAVSVGEVIASKPLVEKLLQDYPHHRLLITTTTPTGSERVIDIYGDRVAHSYFPYDLPEIIHRFLKRVAPKILIVIETEIWPNLYAACNKNNIPLLIVNARLSKRSTLAYQKIRPLVAETLQWVNHIAVRSTQDAQRFLALGARLEQIDVTGNIKFDLTLNDAQIYEGKKRRKKWGESRPVLVVASTHKGEDDVFISLYITLKKRFPDLLMILVPRHPERFDEVFEACQKLTKAGIKTVRHQQVTDYQDLNADIILGDTMGEMQSWFAAADVVFMGGSLVPVGGHNPLEAIALGKPVVSGQYMFNFDDMVSDLVRKKLMLICQSNQELATHLTNHLKKFSQQSHKQEFEYQAVAFMQHHQGATTSCLALVSRYLEH